MDITNTITFISALAALSIPLLLLILGIIFVSSHKRMAAAQEEAAKAQVELAKQLASISIELRHLTTHKS
ncbi:hypothetical protein [Parashewanella tropica]|uniref:hypothetical protein n=1 Tax=Parashewanella tropica TaxID=2547970 RepID=UPI00105A2662|nr:hypothetical protein [Parashewanella tropica]